MRKAMTAVGLLMLLAVALLRGVPPAPARGADADGEAIGRRFAEAVLPFLEANCLACHDAKSRKGDLDLSGYRTPEAVARDLGQWEAVREQVESGAMPPAKAKVHPKAEDRRAVAGWIADFRTLEAARNAGDPGPIPPRRLSNAEYDASVRDLTGVDIRPTKEFPVDPANEAGFDNSAESLAMSPALVRKYLEAARKVSDHLVLKPEGLAFAPHPVVADTDRDKYSVRQIIDFYRKQRTDAADYFLAAWTFRHREALGRPEASLADLAAEAGISPRYLATIWSTLAEPVEPVGPTAALQALWRELPAPSADHREPPKAACGRIRDFVVGLRKQLVPVVKNLTVRGMNGGSQPLVLWKDREFVKNRMRYAGGATKVKPEGLEPGSEAAKAMIVPDDPAELARFEATFGRFCSTFPDAFFVSERARVYIDKEDKGNVGRLLSAGFHSMTGYFRDDAPLAELILDEDARRELETLWREFHFITGDPERQYSSFLWFDRTDSTFLRGAEFDFARAEDKGAASGPMIARLAAAYRAKAERLKASDAVLAAIDAFFREIDAQIRRVEHDRAAAEPSHLRALQAFAARAYRRPLSEAEQAGIVAFYRVLRDQDGLGHDDAVRDSVVGILMSPHFCYRVDLPEPGARGDPPPHSSRPGEPLELFPLVEHARRRAAVAGRVGRAAAARGAGGPGPADAEGRPGPRPGHRVRRQLARLPAVRGAQRRRPRPVPGLRRRAPAGDVRGAGPVLPRRDPRGSAGADPPGRRPRPRQPEPGQALRDARPRRRARRLGPGRGGPRVRPGRLALDGGLPDQELAGPADQPGEAGVLGGQAAAGRGHPRPAGRRARPAESTRRRPRGRSASRSRSTGPTRPARAATSGSTRSAWRSKGMARWASGGRSTSAAIRSTPGPCSPAVSRARGSPASGRTSTGGGRATSSPTSAGSCWPTGWAGA